MKDLIFVKLGGSVITDKNRPETARPEVIERLAGEVARALRKKPEIRLVLGHGSGSFGHAVAQRYGTRQGVRDLDGWRGFAEVAAAAARLNRMVTDTFLAAGVPVWSLQPSASAWCRDSQLMLLATTPVEQAVIRKLVPLVYGDVALDDRLGGTIISTEQIFAYLAKRLYPERLILVSAVDGVFDRDPRRDPTARRVPRISSANWKEVQAMLGGSHAPDVTGGMLSKVEEMIRLIHDLPNLTVHIISGEREGALEMALQQPADITMGGTLIGW